jgi:hypothetical protein
MAIKINNVDVITNQPNIVNVQNANFVGIVTAAKFVGPVVGSNIGLMLVFGY